MYMLDWGEHMLMNFIGTVGKLIQESGYVRDFGICFWFIPKDNVLLVKSKR